MKLIVWYAYGITVVAADVDHARRLIKERLIPVLYATEDLHDARPDMVLTHCETVKPDRVFGLITNPRPEPEVIFFGRNNHLSIPGR